MAFSVDDRVELVNAHNQFRLVKFGTVTQVLSGSKYKVRPDGWGCAQTHTFDEDELRATTKTSEVSYSKCA